METTKNNFQVGYVTATSMKRARFDIKKGKKQSGIPVEGQWIDSACPEAARSPN